MPENLVQNLLTEAAHPDFLVSPKVLESFKTRWIPLRHTGVPSRVFHSWKEAGIITGFNDGTEKERERTMLSIPEYIWTKLVQTLRSFGMNYPSILEVKAAFFTTITPEEYVAMEVDKLNLTDPVLREYEAQRIRDEFNLEVLIPPHEAGGPITHLTLFILACQLDISVRILQNGVTLVLLNGEYMHPEYKKYEGEPYLSLSLNKILFDLLADPAQTDKIEYYELLTEEEMEVIKLMRANNIKRLEIKFNDGQPFAMEWTEGNIVRDSELNTFITAIKMRPYTEMTFRNNNNKTVYVEQTTKQKLKR